MDQDSARRITEEYVARSRDTLIDRMGIRILEASAQRVVGTMPVTGNTQPLGLLHGGASCVLAETLGSLGAALAGRSVTRRPGGGGGTRNSAGAPD